MVLFRVPTRIGRFHNAYYMSHQSRATVVFISFAIFFVISLLWFAYFIFMLGPLVPNADPLTQTERIHIASGDSFDEISQRLVDEGILRSAKFFKLYGFFSGRAHKLKPGLYDLNPGLSAEEIMDVLVRGPGRETVILITEGDTLAQIEKKLLDAAVLTDVGSLTKYPVSELYDEYPFLKGATSLEGFLFPDTYRFFYGSDPDVVVTVLLDTFVEKLSPLIADIKEYERRNIVIQRQEFTIREVVTIASLIEKEIPDSNERRLVSGIMHKRLQIGMPLQIDASVEYAKTHGSRYDTYQFYGLPPGPITNPGIDAIEAALNPRASSYLFYLSDPESGKTIFAKDFEEHKANQEKYLW